MGTELDRPLGTTAADMDGLHSAGNSQATATSDSYPPGGCDLHRRKGQRQDRHGGLGIRGRLPRTLSNTAPKFPAESTARAMEEEMPKGTDIGNPVTATDKDSREMLTYWLAGETDDDPDVRHRRAHRAVGWSTLS